MPSLLEQARAARAGPVVGDVDTGGWLAEGVSLVSSLSPCRTRWSCPVQQAVSLPGRQGGTGLRSIPVSRRARRSASPTPALERGRRKGSARGELVGSEGAGTESGCDRRSPPPPISPRKPGVEGACSTGSGPDPLPCDRLARAGGRRRADGEGRGQGSGMGVRRSVSQPHERGVVGRPHQEPNSPKQGERRSRRPVTQTYAEPGDREPKKTINARSRVCSGGAARSN